MPRLIRKFPALPSQPRLYRAAISIALEIIGLLAIAPEAIAHHPLGGQAPANLFEGFIFEGFISAIVHLVIGRDRVSSFAFAGLMP